MIVYLSAEAESDLESIGDYIAQHNPERAVSFIRELRGQCEQLSVCRELTRLYPATSALKCDVACMETT
jgi:toxin ParE1/3/4